LEAENAAQAKIIVGLESQVAALTAHVATLTAQVALLTEKLGQNSRNSHRPPSSDPPGVSPRKSDQLPRGQRKRGGQPGHRGSRRILVPAESVDHVVDDYPAKCGNCWQPVAEVADPLAKRYQCIELDPVEPHITEYRRHAVRCTRCGYKTRAAWNPNIPKSPFGPRLMSAVAMCTGVYHLSRRQAQGLLRDLLSVRISTGAISSIEARIRQALVPAVAEVTAHIEHAPVKHTDGTSWQQAGSPRSLWTLATPKATSFTIVTHSSKEVLTPLFGERKGILISDRAKALTFWAMDRRQICWAHLIRLFVAFSEREGRAQAFGNRLLECARLVFDYWHGYKSGTLTRAELGSWMRPVIAVVEEVLARAVAADIERLSGSCADILQHKLALWTFIDHDGVEPTNNHAERELRAFVLWRKRSFGTQSDRGNEFAERIMTVAATLRKLGKHLWSFLTLSCSAFIAKTRCPSLFATVHTATAAGNTS